MSGEFTQAVDALREDVTQVLTDALAFADARRGRMTTAKREALLALARDLDAVAGLSAAIRELVTDTQPAPPEES